MSPMVRQPLALEHALLGFLRQRPMHGYELHQQVLDPGGLGRVWHLKQSHLYALLVKLEEAEYITATLENQPPRPPRKVYHLTMGGEAAFQQWLTEPVPHGRALRLEFLAKLYFAQQAGGSVVSRLLAEQRALCQRWLAVQRGHTGPLVGDQSYEALVHRFRQGQIEAMLAWLEECEEALGGCEVAR